MFSCDRNCGRRKGRTNRQNARRKAQSKFTNAKAAETEVEDEAALWGKQAAFTLMGLQLGTSLTLTFVSPHKILMSILSGTCLLSNALVVQRQGTKGSVLMMLVGAGTAAAATQAIYSYVPLRHLDAVLGLFAVSGPVKVLKDLVWGPLMKHISEQMALEEMPTWTQQKKIFGAIGHWMYQDWYWWAGAYSTTLLETLAGTLAPLFSVNVATDMLSGNVLGTFNRTLQLLALFISQYALGTAQKILFQESVVRFSNRVNTDVLQRTMDQDIPFFEATDSAWILTQMSQAESVASVPAELVPGFITSLLSIGTAFGILARQDIWLAVMCVLGVPFDIAMGFIYSQYIQRFQVSRQSIRSRMGTVVNELIRNARVCKMYAAEDHKVGEYFEEAQEMVKLQTKNARVQASSGLVESLIPHIISMGMFVYAASLVLAGKMTYPEMMLVGMYQDTLSEAFGELPGVVVSYGNMTGQNKKVFQILERKPKMRARGDGRADAVRGDIEFRDVSFAYNVWKRFNYKELSVPQLMAKREENRRLKLARRAANTTGEWDDPLDDVDEFEAEQEHVPVLGSFSLTIRAGEKVALVGRSGSGKSTIANMILGMYDPTAGAVLVDGRPVHEYDPTWFYGSCVSAVSQMPRLMRGTFEENLTLGLQGRGFTLDELEAACKKANAHDFIVNSPDGYMTEVGNEGGKLSGGQKQRVAIARTLLRDPSILVLDEATSALDAESEHLVQQAIERAMEGRTVLMIAHRLSTIQNADRIVVLDEGRIVEEGTHEELLRLGGLYTALVQKQLIGDGEGELPVVGQEGGQ